MKPMKQNIILSPPPDPIEAIKFRMEQANLKPKDLKPMVGELNRVYEVLARKRSLTLPMIRRLHADLGIPAESLIAEGTA
jgi:HTH-type transcriptional regulator/antitoxin HigA